MISAEPKMSAVTKLAASWPSLLLLAMFSLLPVYGPFVGKLEGRFWPVTSPMSIVSIDPSGNGINVSYTVTKYRFCEIVGYSASVSGVDTLVTPIIENWHFPMQGLGLSPQRALHLSVSSLTGVEILAIHRCNPLYLTVTKIYP